MPFGHVRQRHERRLQAAQGYLALEMPDHALRELAGIPSTDRRGLASFHRLWGIALQQKREYAAALDAFETSLAEMPQDLESLMGLAWCSKRTGQLSRAISAMEQAYRAHPDEPILLYNLACYLALAGEKEQALSWLGRALRMEGALRKLIPDETDFDSLRHDPDFRLIAGLDPR